MNPELIGRRIEHLIGDEDKEVVARTLGISGSALRMYIAGKRIPKDEVKAKMSKYFGKTVDEIFFNDEKHETCLTKKVG